MPAPSRLLMFTLPLARLPLAAQALLTLAVVVPLGPQLYRLFFQPIAAAPVLVLLIVSIAVHVALVGIGLLAFGPEGAKTRPFTDADFALGSLQLHGQTLWVIAVSLAPGGRRFISSSAAASTARRCAPPR